MQFARYAIYYTPPPDAPWAVRATGWLGRDMRTGRDIARPGWPDLKVDEITRTPRRYGLHATLKPPFRLADGTGPADLRAACAGLARTLAPVRTGPLHLQRMGRFLALCPEGTPALNDLAARCVRDLDRFRAPPDARELDRRRKAGLTPRQERNLMQWGYPHVLEDFRFHITLTERLGRGDLKAAQAALEHLLTPLLPDEFRLDALSLAGEDGQGNFHLIERFTLGG